MLKLKGPVRLLMILALIAFNPPARAALKTLSGHVPRLVAHLSPGGRLAATAPVNLAIGLPFHDPAGVDDFLAQVYDPASPLFRQFLTPDEFADRFGPTKEDYEAVRNFALTNGLVITATHGNRMLLDVCGPAAAVEGAFHVTLRTYTDPVDGREFFSLDAEPSVDGSLPIADISGLENHTRPFPKLHQAAVPVAPRLGTAPNGYSYFGSDFRNAYVPGTALDGSGQSVGLLQFAACFQSDIVNYATLAGGGRTNIPVVPVLIDGATGIPNVSHPDYIAEVSLDIEMAMSMAPGLSQIVLFEGNVSNFIPNHVLNAMAASNTVKNLSSSWGWNGGPSTTTDNIFKVMAAQGQSFFNASGDSGAFLPGFVDNPNNKTEPSSSPYITQVGGTTLTTAGAGGGYVSESVWNSGYSSSAGGYVASSGGVSDFYSIPSWQTGVNSFLTNGGSGGKRNIPDVALTADNVYVIYNNTNANVVGTSCAAPLWAGFMALVNQQAAISGKLPVGFINPAIYELANESAGSPLLHDITTGNSLWPSSTNLFYAVPGYDLCTGVGSPAGMNLINALANPDLLVVLPNSRTEVPCLAGAFPLSAQTFYLTNAGVTPLSWTLINTSAWLNAAPTSGTLAPGQSNAVTVTLNMVTSNLNAGTYTANLWFSNNISKVAHARFFSLAVTPSLVQNGGFETDDFTDWTLVGNTIVGGNIWNAIESPLGPDHFAVAHSGLYGALLGDYTLATLSQSLPTVPGQKYLLSFWVNNPVGAGKGGTEQFLVNWNTNGAAANTIYSLANPAAFAWTNLAFVLTATGTNTTLQFGAYNNPLYFGLDDVSVTAIPQPSFSAVSKVSNGLSLTWTTLPNVGYVVQYKTDLSQPAWLNLAGSITAGSNTLTQVDPNVLNTSPQRFYRVSVSP